MKILFVSSLHRGLLMQGIFHATPDLLDNGLLVLCGDRALVRCWSTRSFRRSGWRDADRTACQHQIEKCRAHGSVILRIVETWKWLQALIRVHLAHLPHSVVVIAQLSH